LVGPVIDGPELADELTSLASGALVRLKYTLDVSRR
jgi:hypothetical protein